MLCFLVLRCYRSLSDTSLLILLLRPASKIPYRSFTRLDPIDPVKQHLVAFGAFFAMRGMVWAVFIDVATTLAEVFWLRLNIHMEHLV